MDTRRVAVFGGGNWTKDSSNWELGVDVGKLLGRNDVEVVTGGYGGAMEAVSQGVVEAGGKTIGILHTSPDLVAPNRFIQQYEIAQDYLQRMAILLRVPRAIALPGKSGTFAEVAVSLAMLQRHEGRSLALWQPYWEKTIRSLTMNPAGSEEGTDDVTWFSEVSDLISWLGKDRP